jgi:hypothetical protein
LDTAPRGEKDGLELTARGAELTAWTTNGVPSGDIAPESGARSPYTAELPARSDRGPLATVKKPNACPEESSEKCGVTACAERL